jgi:hypothetical protein
MERWENRDKDADIESRDEEAQVLIVCYTGRCLRAVSLKEGGAATWGGVQSPTAPVTAHKTRRQHGD